MTNRYNDTEERQRALEILKPFNPQTNGKYDTVDFTCTMPYSHHIFHVDVKFHNRRIDEYNSCWIQEKSYKKYIDIKEPVFSLFLFNDGNYTLTNIKYPLTVYQKVFDN
jgi:hypothetical protein